MNTATDRSRAMDTTRSTSRGAIAAAVIGNWLEFFDFTVYGFFAVIIGKLFFPSADPTTSLLLSVATFAAGFITRPLGSVMLGVYADRKGRKAALNLTIMLMAASTGAIAIARSRRAAADRAGASRARLLTGRRVRRGNVDLA
jgi:MFS transporter, MHS family, proline/betaine transporter